MEYDSAWPEAFKREQQRTCRALGVSETDVEHIGSTAVAGLAAKPVVDPMLGVDVYLPTKQLVSDLVELGYEFLGEAGSGGSALFQTPRPAGFQPQFRAARGRSVGQKPAL